MREHAYNTKLTWTGNTGQGTASYSSYERSYNIEINGKEPIRGSSDPSFRGDKGKHNPEELFLASLSSCHMLWYLHLCAVNNITVIEYADEAKGVMTEDENGSGKFSSVTLYPRITIKEKDKIHRAISLHKEANKMCFIANSCNFTIDHEPDVKHAFIKL